MDIFAELNAQPSFDDPNGIGQDEGDAAGLCCRQNVPRRPQLTPRIVPLHPNFENVIAEKSIYRILVSIYIEPESQSASILQVKIGTPRTASRKDAQSSASVKPPDAFLPHDGVERIRYAPVMRSNGLSIVHCKIIESIIAFFKKESSCREKIADSGALFIFSSESNGLDAINFQKVPFSHGIFKKGEELYRNAQKL